MLPCGLGLGSPVGPQSDQQPPEVNALSPGGKQMGFSRNKSEPEIYFSQSSVQGTQMISCLPLCRTQTDFLNEPWNFLTCELLAHPIRGDVLLTLLSQ